MSDSVEEPDFLSVRCPQCQAGLRIRSRLAGKTGQCPQCGGSIHIPERPAFDLEEPDSSGDADESLGDGGYRLAEPLEHQPDDSPEPLPAELRAPVPAGGFLERMERVSTEKKSYVPQFLFFTGVFTFPWYPEVWLRWGYLVAGGTAATLIPVLVYEYVLGVGGYAGVVLAFFALPQIWISFWTGSFAVACGMHVFEETATGNDHISNWPEPNWRDWMWQLMYVGYVALMVLAVAYGIGLLAGGSGETISMAIGLSEFFLLPFCLLSVMEANNLAILISPGIAATLIRNCLNWIQFYVITGCLAAAWLGIGWGVISVSSFLLIPVNGLLYASLILIWFRLLGRLAWSISHRSGRKRTNVATAAPTAI